MAQFGMGRFGQPYGHPNGRHPRLPRRDLHPDERMFGSRVNKKYQQPETNIFTTRRSIDKTLFDYHNGLARKKHHSNVSAPQPGSKPILFSYPNIFAPTHRRTHPPLFPAASSVRTRAPKKPWHQPAPTNPSGLAPPRILPNLFRHPHSTLFGRSGNRQPPHQKRRRPDEEEEEERPSQKRRRPSLHRPGILSLRRHGMLPLSRNGVARGRTSGSICSSRRCYR